MGWTYRKTEGHRGEVDTHQERILPGVSRTFALTIPELPASLRRVVTTGYLLCRIADTIEDEPELDVEQKRRFHGELVNLVEGDSGVEAFAADLAPHLSTHTPVPEHELVAHAPSVIAVLRDLPARQRDALTRCIRVMCTRMPDFQNGHAARGLRSMEELHDYCYTVAGVVGEMLTELFCDYSPAIEAVRGDLERRAVSFGQGLQMTNILKDVWDDLERGFCWLPEDVFRRSGYDLNQLAAGHNSDAFGKALAELIGTAHGHLRDALEYTLLIPPHEKGIRRFCLWALGMAVFTLRKINRRRDFHNSREVKISRRNVKATILVSNLLTGHDTALRTAFSLFSSSLPAPTNGSRHHEWTN